MKRNLTSAPIKVINPKERETSTANFSVDRSNLNFTINSVPFYCGAIVANIARAFAKCVSFSIYDLIHRHLLILKTTFISDAFSLSRWIIPLGKEHLTQEVALVNARNSSGRFL